MVSQIMVEGVLSVCSSRAVRLHDFQTLLSRSRSVGHTVNLGGTVKFGYNKLFQAVQTHGERCRALVRCHSPGHDEVRKIDRKQSTYRRCKRASVADSENVKGCNRRLAL